MDGALCATYRADEGVDGYSCVFHNGYISLAMAEEPGYYLYDTTGESLDAWKQSYMTIYRLFQAIVNN